MRRLGEHPTYQRLVAAPDREPTWRPYPLGAVVHDGFHQAQNSLLAALAGVSEDGYALEQTTPGERLPAGPETAPWITLGGSRARDYPNARISRVLDRALGAMSGRYRDWVSQVVRALPALAQYEPLGGTMADVVMATCINGETRLKVGQGWRHVGGGHALARGIAGSEQQVLRLLAAAWSLVAVLAVDGDVLAAAEAAGACDAKALAWARARGLVG